jgi:hypothetical protein
MSIKLLEAPSGTPEGLRCQKEAIMSLSGIGMLTGMAPGTIAEIKNLV